MNSKRFIAIILACMMIFTLVPAVHAEEHVHEWVETVVKKADCENKGIVKKTCECGEEVYEQTDYGHVLKDVLVEATCTESASINSVCEICEEVIKTKAVEGEDNKPLGHNLVLDTSNEDYKAQSCTDAGVGTYYCSRCDYTVSKSEAALGHKWSEEGEEVEAGCEHGAGVKYICENGCGEVKMDEFTDDRKEDALGHELEEEVIAPTCTEKGYTLVVCTRCDYEETKDEVAVDTDGHSAVLVDTLKEATCTESGTGKYECELCGADLGYKAIAPAHKWAEIEGTRANATCGEDGKVKVYCTVDGCDAEEEQTLPATGEHSYETYFEDATCTEPAKAGKACTVCGKADGELSAVEGSTSLGHDLVLDTSDEDYKAPTCTEDGIGTYKCSREGCDHKVEDAVVEATGHTWPEDGTAVEVGCEYGAGVKYVCETCGEAKVDEFTEEDLVSPALGHEFEEEVIAPTCTEKGYTLVVCTRCDYEETGDEVAVDENAHSAVLVKTLKEATCTDPGTGMYACEYCEADLGYKSIAPTHSWETVEIITASDCGNDGEIKVRCTVDGCGAEEEQLVPATGEHDYNLVSRDATCTEPAMAGMVCAVCDAVDGEMTAVEGSKPLGHDPELDTSVEGYKAATCTEAGEGTFVCSREGCEYSEVRVIDIIEHNWDDGTWTDAGCENAAGIMYICSECDTVKVDAVEGELAAPATGHNYVLTVVEPTCSTEGVTLMICSNCDDGYEVEGTKTAIVPDAHIPVDTDVIKIADCYETGVVKVECEECEASLGYKTTPIVHDWGEDVLNEDETALIHICAVCGAEEIIETYEGYVCPDDEHVAVIDEGVSATCVANGITEGSHCKYCGETITAQEIIPATGHTEEIIPAVDAACTTDGLTEGKKCSVCGETLTAQEIVPATGHTEETVPAVDATCTADGLTEGKKCSVCGESVTAQEIVPATGHTEETVPVVDATCTTDGLTEGKKCSVCGETLTAQEAVSALGHDFADEWTVDVEPTTETSGLKSRHCSRCDETCDPIEIAKLVDVVDATEIFKDIKVNNWSIDGINYVVSYGYMNGTTEDTFNQTGTMTRAMIVSVLYRIAGQPEHGATNPFADVSESGKWYYDAVIWAYENEIVTGTSATAFSPNGDVTREQIATFLYRYAQYMGYDTSATTDISAFPDEGNIGKWAKEALTWANAEGLITGAKSGDAVILDPQGNATREQVATILMRFCEAFND